jgi:hypothetical protein
MNSKRRIQRIALALLATAGVATATIGVLHAPFARSALMKVGGCPVSKVTAADVEAARKDAVRSLRGETAAKSRPALGFILEGSTPEDVRSWAAEHKISCTEMREGLAFKCTNVPAAALRDREPTEGAISELFMNFRPSDRKLVNLSLTASELSAEDAAARMKRRVEKLTSTVGTPTQQAGEISQQRFAAGGMATSLVSYRYRDYVASVTATAFEPTQVNVLEQYTSAND